MTQEKSFERRVQEVLNYSPSFGAQYSILFIVVRINGIWHDMKWVKNPFHETLRTCAKYIRAHQLRLQRHETARRLRVSHVDHSVLPVVHENDSLSMGWVQLTLRIAGRKGDLLPRTAILQTHDNKSNTSSHTLYERWKFPLFLGRQECRGFLRVDNIQHNWDPAFISHVAVEPFREGF